MPTDSLPPKDCKQCIADTRLLRAEAQASRQHAKIVQEEAARTREASAQARNRAEEICLDVGMKVFLLQMVRQVVRERQRARKPSLPRRKRNRPALSMIFISPEPQVWAQFYRLSPQTACIQ